jgi:DDE family transposase
MLTENREQVPDHSWLSKTRGRLPREVHERVFGWVLKLVAEQGLVKGKRIGVGASTMEANAALRTIVRREDGRTYREMLTRMAKESGIDTPTADDLVRIDRNRKGKKLSNDEWTSKTDPEAKIAKLKDGRTHLAYKPEHAVDLDTGIVVAAALHPADQGDTTTIEGTLTAAEKNLAQLSAAPTTDQPSELAADKGYHSRALFEEPRRRRVEDAHRRTQAAGLLTLARRRQGSCGGLCKPHPSGFASRQASDAAAGRNRRAVVRPQSRPRRDAADLAARTRKCSQTISGPRRRAQPRHPDAAADRGRNPERGGCTCAGLSVFRRHREGRRDHPYRRVLRRLCHPGRDRCRRPCLIEAGLQQRAVNAPPST